MRLDRLATALAFGIVRLDPDWGEQSAPVIRVILKEADALVAGPIAEVERSKGTAQVIAFVRWPGDVARLLCHETSHDFGAAYPAWRCRIRTQAVTKLSASIPAVRPMQGSPRIEATDPLFARSTFAGIVSYEPVARLAPADG